MWQERFEKNSLIRAVGGGWYIFNKDNQPLDSRLALMARSTSSKITERSAQILRLLFSFSNVSWQQSFLKSWLLEGDTEGVEGIILALVFLGMVWLWERKTLQKNRRKTTKIGRFCFAESERERKVEKTFEKVIWMGQTLNFEKPNSRNSIDRKTVSINRNRQRPTRIFYRNFDWSKNRLDRSKL